MQTAHGHLDTAYTAISLYEFGRMDLHLAICDMAQSEAEAADMALCAGRDVEEAVSRYRVANKHTEARRAVATNAFALKIAAHKIEAHGLKRTPAEYVAECQRRTEQANK